MSHQRRYRTIVMVMSDDNDTVMTSAGPWSHSVSNSIEGSISMLEATRLELTGNYPSPLAHEARQ